MAQLWWYLIFPILLLILAADLLHHLGKRKHRLAVGAEHRPTPSVLPEAMSVFANESAADRAEREDIHHQRLVDGGWYDPAHSRFRPVEERAPVDPWGDEADTTYARELRALAADTREVGSLGLFTADHMPAVMETTSVPAAVAAAIVLAPTFPRALTTINATPERGRNQSWIPADEAELAEIVEQGVTPLTQSWRGFDPRRELARLVTAQHDPAVAAAVVEESPMLAFLLPVQAVEVSPEFAAAQAAFNARRRPEPPTIDGEVVEPSWHTGLTTAHKLVPARFLGDAA